MVFIGKYAIAVIWIAVVLIAAIFKGAVAEISVKLKNTHISIFKNGIIFSLKKSFFIIIVFKVQCELTEEFEKNPLLFTLIQPFLSTGESQSQAFMTKS